MKHSVERSLEIDNVSRETGALLEKVVSTYGEKLDAYAEQLLWWNKRINLVSRIVGLTGVSEHIRHSIIPVAMQCYKGGELVLDTGTGGGLPGLPLAITLPDCHFLLNDISEKKSMVLKELVKSLGLQNCEVVTGDLGRLVIEEPCTLTTKHAFKLTDIISKSNNVNWERAIVYKGSDFFTDLREIKNKMPIKAYDLSEFEPVKFYKQKFILLIDKIVDK
ncbi:MAG: RsmG family class I SAM-dependent methyltransferase [Balneolales bacterium]